VSIASARDEIRRRRKLVPIGVDPLKGPWRCLSTGGDYSHELHMTDVGEVVCSTCRGKYSRDHCWATNRVRQSLGLAKQATPEPEAAIGSLSWLDVAREAATSREPKQPNNHFQKE
jgi:hypothetical protein